MAETTPKSWPTSETAAKNLCWISKRLVGIDLGVNRRTEVKSALTKPANYLIIPSGFFNGLSVAVSMSHACPAAWFLSSVNSEYTRGKFVFRRKTCNDIGHAESK